MLGDTLYCLLADLAKGIARKVKKERGWTFATGPGSELRLHFWFHGPLFSASCRLLFLSLQIPTSTFSFSAAIGAPPWLATGYPTEGLLKQTRI